MRATSRALAALAVTSVVLLPGLPAAGLPAEDPAPAAGSPAAPGAAAPDPAVEGATRKQRTAAPIEVNLEGSATAPVRVADTWLLADLDSGEVLASQGADLQVRPASTQKLLTALTVAPRLAPEQPYRAVTADETAEGNRVVLYAGLKYTVADLLHAALLPSANDAANALARANGGMAATLQQMQAEAARLGATSTVVRNPSGLDDDGQLTTARDMALIGREAFANPEIAAYLKLTQVPFPGKVENGKRVVYPIYNHNRMLAHPNFVGPLGGKSGYTSKAGNTLVAAAQRDGRRLLVTLFHTHGNTYRDGETLLNWGFANLSGLRPVGQLAEPSAPAPQFDRTLIPLPKKGQKPATREAVVAASSDAPTATSGASSIWSISSFALPKVGLPSPLTLLTLLMALLVVLRARVYWISHRSRSAWVDLDDWARRQARGARRRGPADPRVTARPAPRAVGDEGSEDHLVTART